MCAQLMPFLIDSDSLGISSVWSESSLSAWRKTGSLATHWAHSKDSNRTGRMPRLIWVFAGHTDHFVGFVMRWLKLFKQSTVCLIFWRMWKYERKNPDSHKKWCNYPKMWFNQRIHAMYVKDTDWMANSVDSEQTAPGTDCSWSSLIRVYTVCPDLSVQKHRVMKIQI